jgi:homoserine kinase
MPHRINAVTVRVPGTTSNLGPGFDTLGVALAVYNRVSLRPNGTHRVRLVSPVAESARAGAVAMLEDTVKAFLRATRGRRLGCDVHLEGDVPIARGLGSSVTVRLGVAAALNVLAGACLSRQALLDLVAALEHHPDNAAPAVFGGLTAAGVVESAVRCLRFPLSSRLRFVALIPRYEISTERARRLLPGSFSRADTVHNLNRAALITAAFAARDYAALRGLFEDRVHEPYRERLIPPLRRVIAAGVQAGALGGWLSGSGSTIMCLTQRAPRRVGEAMLRELPQADLRVLSADNRGFVVEAK